MKSRRWIRAAGIVAVIVGLSLALGAGVVAESKNSRLDELKALLKAGKYADAESGARALLAEVQSSGGADSVETARVLDVLVNSLNLLGNAGDPETRELAERAVAIKEQRLGSNDVELAASLQSLSLVLVQIDEMTEAKRTCKRALEIRESVLGPEHIDVGESLYRLARLQYIDGDPTGAIPLFERALAIQEKSLGPDDVVVGKTLNDLAELNRDLGQYTTARRLHERCVAIMEKTFGPDSRKIIFHLNNLATVLDEMGDYSQAKPLRERALALATKHYGPDSPYTAPMLTNLGQLLDTLGDYAGARPLLERALAIDEKQGPADDPNIAADLINLAATVQNMGDPSGAGRLLERAIAIMEKGPEPDHPLLAKCLSNLAQIRAGSRDYAAAWPLYGRALIMMEKNFTPDHPWVGDILIQVADARYAAGDYAQAKALFERAITIERESRGPEHPSVAIGLGGLAAASFQMGERTQALEASLGAEQIGRETVRLTSRTLSEREALDYASHRPSGLDIAISIAAASPDAFVKTRVWDAVIRSRALVFDEMISRHRVLGGADPQISALSDKLMSTSSRVAFLLVHGAEQSDPDSYRELLDEARRDKELAEHALAEKSLPFREELAKEQIGFADVAKRLPSGGGLVAYVLFDRFVPGSPRTKPKAKRGSTTPKSEIHPTSSYAAFVLRSGEQGPAMVPLGTAKEIESLVSRWQSEAALGAIVSREFAKEAESAYRAAGEALRRKVWDPVAAALGDAARAFVIQEGALNLVSLASLPVGASEYLVEGGPLLHYLPVERDLVPSGILDRRGQGLLAVGGPAFDDTTSFAALAPKKASPEQPAVLAAQVATPATHFLPATRSACGDFKSVRFEPLSGAARETDEVAIVWQRVNEGGAIGNVTRLTGVSASEAAFKRSASGHRTLHFATHGFFLEGRCASALESFRGVGGLTSARPTQPASEGENPLLLSGLALAGANHRDAAAPDEEDGILTAEEIAAMDLTGVDWAVLSACDTGRGEIKVGEGVFGLRRAFQVAGAGTLIMSLWSVEDESTRAWMKALYDGRLVRKLDTPEAVRDASLAVMKQRRAAGESTHPFYWAAFVAAGDWR